MNKFLKVIIVFFFSLILFSCVSGGTSGTGATSTGPTNDDVSKGTISGFGSVIVNGVEFDTSSTSISIDGESGKSQSDLQIGMVVTVSGDINGTTGTANAIVVEDMVEGPVDQIIDNNTIVVMGQTVLIDSNTLYDNNVPDFAGINLNDVLEISGHIKGNGIISASFIEKKPAPFDYEVKGFVTSHNQAGQSIVIGGLTVNYATADISNMPNPLSTNWSSLLVKAKGTILAGGVLTATQVEPFGLGVTDAAESEIEGFVTAINSASSFVLEELTVVHDASTTYVGGLPDEIAVGTKLEVEGTLSNGTLTADKISFRDNVKLEADADMVNAAGGSMTLSGLPGITVTVDNLTEYKGGINSLSDVVATNHLRIRGRETSGNTVLATEIELRSADTRTILQATVDSFAVPNVTLLGVMVDTSSISPANGFRDVNDNVISSAAFFNSLATGTLVKARGDLGMAVTWDEIELEE